MHSLPAGQVSVQKPPAQPHPLQTAPHAPQFCGSLLTSMQPLPQFAVPKGHAHVPWEQTVPKRHG
jgi:hypothetical protein